MQLLLVNDYDSFSLIVGFSLLNMFIMALLSLGSRVTWIML